MRLSHVVPSLDVAAGGLTRSVMELCAAEASLGATVTLLTMDRPPYPTGRGFEIRAATPLRGTRQAPTTAWTSLLRREVARAEIVHLHSLWNPAVALAARQCRRAAVPFVLSPHGMLQTVSMTRKPWRKRLALLVSERATLSSAAAFRFLSEVEARDSVRLTPDDVHVAIIPNGVDPGLSVSAQADRFLERYPRLKGKEIVLFLGRLHWSKQLDLQFEALSLLDRQDLYWVLVGPDEGERDRLERLVDTSPLADRVLYTGEVEHETALDALAAADVVLLTSRHEAHSMTMNEALAVGVPLVMTDTVGFTLASDRGAARMVPGNPEALASAVGEILDESQEPANMRATARQLVAEILAWPFVARATLDLYRRTIDAAK